MEVLYVNGIGCWFLLPFCLCPCWSCVVQRAILFMWPFIFTNEGAEGLLNGNSLVQEKNRSRRADQTIPVNRLQPSAKQNATIEKNNQRQQHCTNTMSEVRAAHLLIKHTGSRNPTSRRTGLPVTITPDQAMNEINYYLSQIQNHPDGVHSFPTFARERSDCSSFRNDGDLGVFGRGMMQRPFEESAFGLGVEEMSGVVSTDSGLHLIYRIA